jgi:hypothetical protein
LDANLTAIEPPIPNPCAAVVTIKSVALVNPTALKESPIPIFARASLPLPPVIATFV